MQGRQITKSVVDRLRPRAREYTVWDAKKPGFGVRVRPSGAKSYIVTYRPGSGGRAAPVRRHTIGSTTKLTAEQARKKAGMILGAVALGDDPAKAKLAERRMLLVADLADRFLADHADTKLKPRTAELYRDILNRIVKPEIGRVKADKLSKDTVIRLHARLKDTPYQANRVLAVLGKLYAFAGDLDDGLKDINPARGIKKFKESGRERYLTVDELERIGAAIRTAETTGLPWEADEVGRGAKHLPKIENRVTRIHPCAAAALRLLLFTGCRLREILDLRWEHVDIERGLLFLPDSKTGRKTVVLNPPALSVLSSLERSGPFVIAGDDPQKPRADLKRPWQAVSRAAKLEGVRLHDLRHTYASVGAAGGLGLPIIGKLLGHSQPSTTARYAHLDNDPLRRASEHIGGRIAAALGEPTVAATDEGKAGKVVELRSK